MKKNTLIILTIGMISTIIYSNETEKPKKIRLTIKPRADEKYTKTSFYKGPGYIRTSFPSNAELPAGFKKIFSFSSGDIAAAKKEISYKNEKYSSAYDGYEGKDAADQQEKLTLRLLSRIPQRWQNNRGPVDTYLSKEEINFYKQHKFHIRKLTEDEQCFLKAVMTEKYNNNYDNLVRHKGHI
jgi:hypothetical protein